MTTLPPAFATMIASFKLARKAAGKAKSTVWNNIDATERLGRWIVKQELADEWEAVTKQHIQLYLVFMREEATGCWCGKPKTHAEYRCPKGQPYKSGYANNQYRGFQQFFKWLAEEEGVVDPTVGLTPPPIDDEVIPVIETDDLARLIHECEKGKDFNSRRDAAILRLYACAGGRLTELAELAMDDIDLERLEALVTGKGRNGTKQRVVKFDVKCAQAIDRYLRLRSKHKLADKTRRLWLAVKNRGPLTPNGIRQAIERRGEAVGIDIHPHLFRHTFSHRWLDAGGSEGDLMELMGWESPQMLRRYGRSARSARARRAYDRVNVMGDI